MNPTTTPTADLLNEGDEVTVFYDGKVQRIDKVGRTPATQAHLVSGHGVLHRKGNGGSLREVGAQKFSPYDFEITTDEHRAALRCVRLRKQAAEQLKALQQTIGTADEARLTALLEALNTLNK